MAHETFRDTNFRPESHARILQCNDIIEDYQQQGLRLTLRQLYYQLVTKNMIPNDAKSYKNLGAIVSDARYAGMMDWDAIEDRGRDVEMTQEWEDIGELVDTAVRAYRLPRWRGQNRYVELWVEKAALAGVLDPIRREYHIPLMVNKGYSSSSAMYASAKRIEAAIDRPDTTMRGDREPVILYLGDHDPSGEDMVRDIEDRLEEFNVSVVVAKVALTTVQVAKYKPPPNPAKVTDSRAAKYIAKHGHDSWEVDALPPNVLTAMIRAVLDALIDRPAYDAVVAQEKDDKDRLRKAMSKLKKGK